MRLVFQINTKHMRYVLVTIRHELKISNPLRFGITVGVPQFGNRIIIRAMMVKKDIDAGLIEFVDDVVQRLQAVQVGKIRIQTKINTGHAIPT